MSGTHLPWLVRLRWGAIVGQICTIAFVHAVMGIRLPLAPLAALIAVETLVNVGLVILRHMRRPETERLLAATLAADVVILTGILFFTGGPFNPFSFLYLVYLALAAVVLSRAWIWALVGLSVVCSAGLFYGNVILNLDESNPQSHMQHMQMHMQGMWIAFTVAACFIGYFIARVPPRAASASRRWRRCPPAPRTSSRRRSAPSPSSRRSWNARPPCCSCKATRWTTYA
jgi:two-component system sensor histidine kinase RegB